MIFSSFLPQFLLTPLSILGIAYLAAFLFLLLAQNRLIFFPVRPLKMTPKDLGFEYEDVRLSVATPAAGQNEKIHGWWIPAATSPGAAEISQNPETFQGVLLFLHGNRSNISTNLKNSLMLQALGLDILAIDYRGYGQSTGKFPTENQVYEDVETVWNYLVHQRQINPQHIFIYGHSLGGAIAVELAYRHPKMGGLILEGTFTSIREMINFKKIYSIFPIDWVLNQRFDSIKKIPQLPMPILYIHGTADRSVPFNMSQVLFEVTKAPKDFYRVPDAGHNNLAAVAGDEYLQKIGRFLAAAKIGTGNRK